MITGSVNSRGVQANLSRLQKVGSQMVDRLQDIGYEILRLSQREVPHDKGTLQNSGTVEEVRGSVVVGYHTPYAARLHEHPEYRFQKGRKGKYLEDPIMRNRRALGLKLSKDVSQAIRGAIR